MRQDQGRSLAARLESRLKGPKPGFAAQLKMAPEPRPGQKTCEEVRDTCREAAVLVLIYPLRKKLHLVLTLRTSKVDHHRDQVSFPGGEKDGHETIPAAALREAREELGVPASVVEVVGQLTPLYVPPSNYCIFPVVATARKGPRFRPAPAEVAEVIELPLEVLLDPGSVRREVWNLLGRETVVPYYAFGGHKIWGATAMILAEFAEIIAGL